MAYKEKRSSYALETGYRYDGIYRTEMCWRKNGIQGHKVCRYLFVRCENKPAPWTSDDYGDRPRPLPEIGELKDAVNLTKRKGDPSWDYDGDKCSWLWKLPPPYSKKQMDSVNPEDGIKIKVRRRMKNVSVKEKLLKEFSCSIYWKVLASPFTAPCGHNFCKACVEGVFFGLSLFRKRTSEGGRTLRAQKNVMKCPLCPNDIADFLQNPQSRNTKTLISDGLNSIRNYSDATIHLLRAKEQHLDSSLSALLSQEALP